MSDLFRTIEDFDVQPDEFWSAMGYLTRLGQANEIGLLAPGLGIETSSTCGWTRRSGRPASRAARRAPSKARCISPARRFRRTRRGSTTAASKARCCSWTARSATPDGKPGRRRGRGRLARQHARAATRIFDPSQPKFNLRRRIETDGEGRYRFRSLLPAGYGCPPDGATQELLDRLGRHGRRPAHIHFFVAAPGYRKLTTQINIDGDAYLHDDFAFATRDGLIPRGAPGRGRGRGARHAA